MSLLTELKKEIARFGLKILGRYPGVYDAICINNKDPKFEHRIELQCPAIGTTKVWANARSLYHGKDFGMYLLPENGENVRVSFLDENIDFPLWEFGAISRTATPQKARGKTFTFISPKGTSFIIDDSETSIYLEHPDGYKIKLSNEGIEIAKGEYSMSTYLKELLDLVKGLRTTCGAGEGKISITSHPDIEQMVNKIQDFLIAP